VYGVPVLPGMKAKENADGTPAKKRGRPKKAEQAQTGLGSFL